MGYRNGLTTRVSETMYLNGVKYRPHDRRQPPKQVRHNGLKGHYWHRPTLENTNTDDVKVTVENIPQEEYF